jgi:hypothetical protein
MYSIWGRDYTTSSLHGNLRIGGSRQRCVPSGARIIGTAMMNYDHCAVKPLTDKIGAFDVVLISSSRLSDSVRDRFCVSMTIAEHFLLSSWAAISHPEPKIR